MISGVSERQVGGARRAVRLAGLPAAHAGRMALGLGKRIGGRPSEAVVAEVQARTAAQVFRTLGELKGGAMKLGQAMSAMEPMLPAEVAAPYLDTLTRLQEAAPPLPWAVMRDVLAEEFGADWRDRFTSFDEQPSAAASIGQVHRATWRDGREVAVKVQYPGAGEALTADLRHLERIVRLARIAAPGVDLPELVAQLRVRLLDELDYEQEATAQREFAAALDGDAEFAVPGVVDAGHKVLVTEWLDRRPLADVIRSGTRTERDRAGLLLTRLFLSSPSRFGRIHGDPHPGNFGLVEDGRLAVLDFGSSEPLSRWPPLLRAILTAGRDQDVQLLHDRVVSANLIEPDTIDPLKLAQVLDPWMAPLRVEHFEFTRSWLLSHAKAWSDPRSDESRLQRKVRIPTRHLLVQRVAFGLLGVLTSLHATVPVRHEAETWIPQLR